MLGRGSFVVFPLARASGRDRVEGWTAVRLEDGRTAYVDSALVRSPIDYRAVFARRDGHWQMVIFLAGD